MMNIRGVFSSYDLSDVEKDTFAEYLKYSLNTPLIPFLQYLLGEDGYLQFVDIFSGSTIKIPSMKVLERDLEAVQIFLYLKKGGFTENSIRMASRVYGKTILTVRRYADKVCRALAVEDTIEDPEVLNNYLLYIKSVDDPNGIEISKEESHSDGSRDRVEVKGQPGGYDGSESSDEGPYDDYGEDDGGYEND